MFASLSLLSLPHEQLGEGTGNSNDGVHLTIDDEAAFGRLADAEAHRKAGAKGCNSQAQGCCTPCYASDLHRGINFDHRTLLMLHCSICRTWSVCL